MKIRTNLIIPVSRSNGPGKRYTIWVQGCSIKCIGCSNKDTWDPGQGQDKLIEDIVSETLKDPTLDGITITGGEPLDQFQAITYLCSRLFGRISIFLTTGYTMTQVQEKGFYEILRMVDILCTGPFDQGLICHGQWRGSLNQEINYLTSMGLRQAKLPVIPKEIHINSKGDTLETGFTNTSGSGHTGK